MRALRALPLALFVLVVASAAPTMAQPAPSAAELRARLDRVRQNPPAGVPDGSLTTVEFLTWLSQDIEGRFAAQAPLWRRRAGRYLDAIEQGRDPLLQERGKIANRGYHSDASLIPQGYAIYLPEDYDPSRPTPLYVALHGGSSNGNLFLGVVLGNNMDWLTYNQHLWDEFTPLYKPNWIVVAPTGFGQMLWRWQAEQDVLDVIADVQKHYNVDPNQIVLGGLSNGGIGAYTIGMRHAWRFSTVMAMAGAPSWLMYAPCPCDGLDRENVMRYSGMHLTENSFNTDWRSYHGRVDPGPMRPAFVQQFEEHVHELGLPARITWYNTGHDILNICHQRGNIYNTLAPVHRNPHPREVRLVTGDYRAARQHWLTVTRITEYPRLARLKGVVDGDTVRVETSNTTAFEVDLRDVPVEGENLTLVVDGDEVHRGPRGPLGHVAAVVRRDGHWQLGYVEDPEGRLVKRAGLAGPINDAYYGRMIHVYGTRDAAAEAGLRAAAERGARGWVLWSWDIRQQVVKDTEVTDAMMRDATVVLYGTAESNAVLERMRDRLPIRIERDAVVVGTTRYAGPDVGVRFIYPNPLSEGRYVIVQGGVTTDAVARGNGIPEFLPDWFVYDRNTFRRSRGQSRHAAPSAPARASGFFDENWQLRSVTADARELPADESFPLEFGPGGDDSRGGPQGGTLPVPPAPAVPPRPTRFLVHESTPEGRAARMIADRIQQFHNYRAQIHGAVWEHDPAAVWSVRPADQCLADLEAQGVPYRAVERFASPLVPVPVQIGGEVNGVRFFMAAADRPFVVACELAAKLPRMAEVLRRIGVTRVGVVSAYRDNPFTSFHTMGLALDIGTFGTEDGRTLRVLGQFRMTPDRETCAAEEPSQPNARDLLHVACELARSRLFSSVLTPNYNVGHHDHFHVDTRPDDPRFFLR